MLNIAIGKIGKKFYFNKNKWTINSGDSEVSSIITALAQMNPKINFYLIGTNDWDKIDDELKNNIAPQNNVINVWEDFKNTDNRLEWINNYFKKTKVNIDFGLIFAGPTSMANVPEKTLTLKNKTIAKVINMSALYAAPIIHYLNTSKLQYFMLGEDPRYFPCPALDLFNRPIGYLNSYSGLKDVRYYNGYLTDELIYKTEKLSNIKYDRLFLISEKPNENLNTDFESRDIKLDVYTNGNGSSGKKKLKIINEYIFNNKETNESIIYGKWSDKLLTKENKNRFDATAMADMVDKLNRTRYTLMFHFEFGYPSSKFWKMIYFGIIPFYHPNMDKYGVQPIHEWLRVKSASEFISKVNQIENDRLLYRQMFDYLQNRFIEKYYNGEYLNNIFFKLASKFTSKENLNYLKENTKNLNFKQSVLFK